MESVMTALEKADRGKFRRLNGHFLEGEFGNCLRCGAHWECAEDHECKPNMAFERLAAYAARQLRPS